MFSKGGKRLRPFLVLEGARLFGVGVEKFSLGFGPRLVGKKIGITDYRLSLMPLGGYVKMVGEEPDEELEPNLVPISFTHKHVVKRILIVFAGPFFNILLAVLIFFVISWATGILILKPSVGSVKEGTPAFQAGFQKGDLITAINGAPVETWEEMADRIARSNGQPLEIVVARPEGSFVLGVTPELITTKNLLGEDIRRYVIGIGTAGDTHAKPLSLLQSESESFRQTYAIVETPKPPTIF